jgi:ABC-2 type transport system ATP-binding protein
VKRFRRVTALDGVDLSFAEGDAVALLGPNGAGKTTLLTILAGVATPNEGTITWRPGTAPRVGWVPQRPALYGRLTVRENLRLFAALERDADPQRAAERLLERADLLEFADRPALDLSTGTAQRLNLAIALAGDPSVLLLDEPTATLSPDQRVRLWAWMDGLREQDRLALLFSTQSVDEAIRHADRMAVLSRGRVVFEGDRGALLAAHGDPADPDLDAAEEAFLRLVGSPG